MTATFGSFGGRSFAGGGMSSFARTAPGGGVGAIQPNRTAGNLARGRFGPGFRHGRHFFAGGYFGPGFYDDYWDYPDYAYYDYPDYYGYDSNCYIVNRRVHTTHGWRIRPVQVCS